jgi:hypothetical protein
MPARRPGVAIAWEGAFVAVEGRIFIVEPYDPLASISELDPPQRLDGFRMVAVAQARREIACPLEHRSPKGICPRHYTGSRDVRAFGA